MPNPPPRRGFDPRLLEGSISRSLFLLAVPIMGANILQVAYQLVDAFWVGRLGADAVAAVSVTMPIMFLLVAAGMGFAIAGTTLIAQYTGARDHDMVDHVAAQTLLTILAVSIALGALGFVLTPVILKAMGVSPAVYDGALSFMRVIFAALPFTFIYAMAQALMRGVGEVRAPLYIVASTVVVNFFLDPILIFGRYGAPAWGVTGAAIATLIAQAFAAAIALRLLFGGRRHPHPLARLRPRFRLRQARLPARLSRLHRAIGARAGHDGAHLPDRELRHGGDGELRRRLQRLQRRDHPGDGILDGDVDAGRPEHRRRESGARGEGGEALRRHHLRRADLLRDPVLPVRARAGALLHPQGRGSGARGRGLYPRRGVELRLHRPAIRAHRRAARGGRDDPGDGDRPRLAMAAADPLGFHLVPAYAAGSHRNLVVDAHRQRSRRQRRGNLVPARQLEDAPPDRAQARRGPAGRGRGTGADVRSVPICHGPRMRATQLGSARLLKGSRGRFFSSPRLRVSA